MQALNFIRPLGLIILGLAAPFGAFANALSPVPIASICDLSSGANVIGLALDRESKAPLYCEYHFDEYQGDFLSRSVVKYRGIDKQQFAEKTVDFSVSSLAPNVIQRDTRQGEVRTLNYSAEDQRFLLEYKKNNETDKKSASVKKNKLPSQVADAGFDVFIKEKWSPLLFGQSVDLAFLSPVHTRGFTLSVRIDKTKTCGSISYDTGQSVCFTVTPKSSLLKLFAKPLNLLYSRDTRQLEVFSGVVNLVDDQGDSKVASIYYWHQP